MTQLDPTGWFDSASSEPTRSAEPDLANPGPPQDFGSITSSSEATAAFGHFADDGTGTQATPGGPAPAPSSEQGSETDVTTGTTWNFDPALDPLRGALNDNSLSFAERAQLMVEYRDAQIAGLDEGVDAMLDMREFDPNNPLTLTGAKRGMHHNLYAKLADDPEMQQMMSGLVGRINGVDPDELDIEQIFFDTQQQSRAMAGEDEDGSTTNLRALQAMATLANFNKFGDDLPPELADKVPPELWEQIQTAGKALQQSESPNAAVMSHGEPAKIITDPDDSTMFTADHNYHFFSHAYLTASLMHDKGLDADQAMHISGLVGAQYELLPGSLGESQGNSGIKDILMNAEGAALGADSMSGDPMLPGMHDGPPVENRQVRDMHPDHFPEEVTEIADDATGDARWLLGWEKAKEEAVDVVTETPKRMPLPWFFL